MIVEIFPRCCGAGVLILEHLTGQGEKADLEFIKSWVYYARRNGYRHYDFPEDYGGQSGKPGSGKAIQDGAGDQKRWSEHNSWGMLLAMTNPGQKEIGKRLLQFGFKELMQTHNPVYGNWVEGKKHPHWITLYGLDMNPLTEAMLKPGSAYPLEESKLENPFYTMTGTLGRASQKHLRGPDGRFISAESLAALQIEKAPDEQSFDFE